MKMRELKFRAWSIEGNRYCDFVTLDEDGRWIGWIKSCGIYLSTVDIVLEQFTGLKDKNGKEIYAGDIVRVSYGYNYEVRQFRTGAWRIGRDDLYAWADSSEIIGNINENPELLREEEE